jgi:hypothetical protein
VSDPLARLIGRSPTDEAQLRAMRAAAFHQRGFVCVHLDDIRNPIDRQVVENLGERMYGKRITRPNAKDVTA